MGEAGCESACRLTPEPSDIYNGGVTFVLTTRTIPSGTVEIVERDFWLWPNLLTLQAPLVAVLWQTLLAKTLRVAINPFAPCALASAVWLIYVADHLIDTARLRGHLSEPPRKKFCRGHWEKFLVMAIVVGCVLAAGVSRFLWEVAMRVGWQLSLGVVGYFALIHLTPKNSRREWPREVVVAMIFTLGTFGAVWLADEQKSWAMLAPALLFLALCCTNCSVIETWEWEAGGSFEEESPNCLAVWLAGHLPHVGLTISMAAGILVWLSFVPQEFALAAALSGAGFAWLARLRFRLPIRFVSPVADLALCSPIIGLALTHFAR